MIDSERRRLGLSLNRHILAGAAAIMLLIGGLGSWAATTELSSAVVASGTLVIEGNSKKVQHPDGGVIAQLFVREGQSVDTGELLIKMDDTAIQARLAAVEKNIAQLLARRARLQAERDDLPSVTVPDALDARVSGSELTTIMASETRLFNHRRQSRSGQKARLHEQSRQLVERIAGLKIQHEAKIKEIDLIGKEREGQYRLFSQGLTSMNRVNNLDRSTARLEGESGELIASIAASRARITELELQILQIDQDLRTEVATELRDVENNLSALAEDEIIAREQLRHSDVRAPIAGIVHLLSVYGSGEVIRPADLIMEIVPEAARLVVEAQIRPQDIDQLRIGMGARLHLSAFNRNTTPQLSGHVDHLSADLEVDSRTGLAFYRVRIAIPKDELALLPESLALLPGMPVETFIMTGDRSVLSYFAKPIQDHASRAFREE